VGHTPGPWEVIDIYDVKAVGLRIQQNQDSNTSIENIKQAKDNANLIAAAPELLEAFKDEHMNCHGADPFKECAGCKLIAKAEGRS
jgi:hypothetical protein